MILSVTRGRAAFSLRRAAASTAQKRPIGARKPLVSAKGKPRLLTETCRFCGRKWPQKAISKAARGQTNAPAIGGWHARHDARTCEETCRVGVKAIMAQPIPPPPPGYDGFGQPTTWAGMKRGPQAPCRSHLVPQPRSSGRNRATAHSRHRIKSSSDTSSVMPSARSTSWEIVMP